MGRRIAIIGGIRTPYVKAGTLFSEMSAVDLGRLVISELLARQEIDPHDIHSVVIGNVAQPMDAVNVARVISLFSGIPEHVPAFTVHRNCASGMQAITSAAQLIATGKAEVVVAGGVESMSNIPFFIPKKLQDAITRFRYGRSWKAKLKPLLGLRPRHFVPKVGLMLGLNDPTCGLNMGQTAELLAREFKISRVAQDEFAVMSHQRAGAARSDGRFNDEIMPVLPPPRFSDAVTFDNGVRLDQSMELLSSLKPVFDKKYGTVTPGNSSQITDGGAAVLMTSEEAALRRGLEPMGFIRAHAFAGLSPKRMGLGPAYSTSLVLDHSDIDFSEIGLIEMNEAFAAQVIANEMIFDSDQLSEKFLGRQKAIGRIDRGILNVNGGAIAMGHPVGSSGVRLVLTLLIEMQKRSVDLGLATLCIGGGQGAAMILERK